MVMVLRASFLFVLPCLLCACLEPGPEPSGDRLFGGQHLESPGFMKLDGDLMLRFHDRIAPATTTRAGIYDLWFTSLDGKEQRKIVADVSDFWGQSGDSAGNHYYMVDETLVATNGGMARTGTLLRLDPGYHEDGFRLPGIWAYTFYNVPVGGVIENPQPDQACPGYPTLKRDCPQILYERPALPGQVYPTLYLWDGQNEIPIGADAGSFQLQPTGSGSVYFIFEAQRTLARLVRPQNVLQLIRPGISRFMISGDEHYAALAITTADGRPKTIILDLTNGHEIELARPNPSGWNGFGNHTFGYAQNATGSDPAELHTLDLETDKDTFDTLPSPLVNLAGIINRPGSDERLLLDSSLRGVFTGQNDYLPRRAPLLGPLYTPSFTHDGKYLAYVAPAAATLYDTFPQGPLMFQDAELQAPASMASPSGLLVETRNGASYFFTGDDNKANVLVFWAHLGRASSDLYFADYDGGGLPTHLRLMAQAILNVSISIHSLFGVVNMSQQDGVGDLVYVNFDDGTQTRYAQAVSEATQYGGSDLSTSYAAYIVRGRADSDRSGLWLTTLAPSTPPDGATTR
jgi:hypothetical protein